MRTKPHVLQLLSLVLLFLCSSLHASNWEPPTVISGGGSNSVDIACDDNGNVVAVWLEGSDIKSAYRPAGGLWESPVTLSTTAINSSPKVCIDGNGTLTAVWITGTGATSNFDSAYRVAGGSWVASPLPTADDDYLDLTIACIPSGRVAVCWFNAGNSRIEVIFRETTFVWGPGVVNAGSGGGISKPIVQYTSSGRVRVAYITAIVGLDGQIAMASGSFTTISVAWLSFLIPGTLTSPTFDFALNDNNNGVIAINSGAAPQTIQSMLVVAGTPSASSFQQISAGPGTAPRVGIDNNGVATVVWEDGDGTIHSGVTTVTSTPSNVFVNQQVTEGVPGGIDSNPRLNVSTNGGMVLQWFRTSTPSNEVYHKVGFGGIFEPTAGTPAPTSIPAKPGDVCMSNNGTAFAAWQLSQGGDTFIEASKTIPGSGLLQQGLNPSKKRVIFQRGLFN